MTVILSFVFFRKTPECVLYSVENNLNRTEQQHTTNKMNHANLCHKITLWLFAVTTIINVINAISLVSTLPVAEIVTATANPLFQLHSTGNLSQLNTFPYIMTVFVITGVLACTVFFLLRFSRRKFQIFSHIMAQL